jgi:hypothetical protein
MKMATIYDVYVLQEEVAALKAALESANEDAEQLADAVELAYNVSPTWEAELKAALDKHAARVGGER